jgi:conjugative transfer signal peptidase TraF
MTRVEESRALAVWGHALRAERAGRSKLRKRALALAGLMAALAATVVLPPRPLLVWNASASLPTGLYRVAAPTDLTRGDLVVAHLPDAWRTFSAVRRYIPANVPLVKRIAASPGETVCARGRVITIDGRRVAERRLRDGSGRLMPWWAGCVTLRNGSVFLMADAPASFDGRYFGPSSRGDLLGRAFPLWTR